MEPSRSVTVWSAGSLAVWARRTPTGALVLEGQDLDPGIPGADEYEYAWLVQEDDVPRVLEALGADAAADPLDVLEERGAEVVRSGEGRWLRGHGIEAQFWCRRG